MSVSYIEEQTKVTKGFSIEPELYIYLQKKAKDDNISIDEVLNQIIRDNALNSLKRIQYVPYRECETYTYPTYPTITCDRTTNITASTNNQTDLFKYFEKDV